MLVSKPQKQFVEWLAVKLPERKALYVDNRPIGALLPCTYAKKHGENIKNTPQASCGDFDYLNRSGG